jgi:hypothetical protein
MGTFRILMHEPLEKEIEQLDASERIRVEKILRQLYEKGGTVGKPLSGLAFLREKKFDGKRLYFLVYEQWSVILVVAIGGKKAQQATINSIVHETVAYQVEVFDYLRKSGLI